MTDARKIIQVIVASLLLIFLSISVSASVIFAIDVYLLLFLAILCGVLFSRLAFRLQRFSGWPYAASLTTVVTLSLVLVSGTAVFFGYQIDRQIRDSSDEIEKSLSDVRDWLREHPAVSAPLARVPFVEEVVKPQSAGQSSGDKSKSTPSTSQTPDAPRNNSQGDSSENKSDHRSTSEENAASGAAGEAASAGWTNISSVNSFVSRLFGVLGRIFSTTFGVVMNVAFVLFVGTFLAVKPEFYRDRVAVLFPKSKRHRVVEILNQVGDTLFGWLIGRGITMAITGVGTGVVLWLLGVPLAFTLAVVTGVATFVPNIGAVFALILSMLVAVSQGPSTVMWVVIAYGALQFIESNVLTPLVQQQQTPVPPPLLLTAQLMMGVLTGFLGVLVSTPLVASIIVIVREAYVNDVLEREVVPGESTSERREANEVELHHA